VIGRGTTEHTGSVGDSHSSFLCFGEIDIVKTHGNIGDNFELLPCHIEELTVDFLCERHDRAICATGTSQKLFS
jgi:hypothetical protein